MQSKLIWRAAIAGALLSACNAQHLNNTHSLSANSNSGEIYVFVTSQRDARNNPYLVFSANEEVDQLQLCRAEASTANQCKPSTTQRTQYEQKYRGRSIFMTPEGVAVDEQAQYIALVNHRNGDERKYRIRFNAESSPSSINWKAVLMTGDYQYEAWDNAREKVYQIIKNRGVKSEHIKQLSMDSAKVTSEVKKASSESLKQALRDLKVSNGDGCFVFMTSHGTQQGFFLRNQGHLTASELSAILDETCKDAPTVALISACYSGVFLEGDMKKNNRIILTAARPDRTSFGCDAKSEYTWWDRCLIEKLPSASTWQSLYQDVKSCVTDREKQSGERPSEPMAYFGSQIDQIGIFDKDNTINPSDPSSDPSGNNLASLGDKNLRLANKQGERYELNKLMGAAEYAMIDFSQAGCPACVSFANRADQYDSNRCKVISIITGLQSWNGPTAHAYEAVDGWQNAARKFDLNITGTPTVIAIDRNGNVVSEPTHGVPQVIEQNCR